MLYRLWLRRGLNFIWLLMLFWLAKWREINMVKKECAFWHVKLMRFLIMRLIDLADHWSLHLSFY
ncbi:hypothetical protein CS022_05780 [Veronia nyctiphanis]|uniref:Uncharacterized protein n=1 Tax=Veronia nyctiphanis TaxID=1278244 RepID=A0A4Q0YSJ2_9GAMM|nr:hypothetical protein CS022_05780 [Veronia nyctiphanis]